MTAILPLHQTLAGRVIALPETRELDLFADMLEKRGATALRCPLVSIKDTSEVERVEAWLRRCIAGELDDLILLTGEGLRRLLGFAARAGLHADFVSALGRLRKITRGPKPDRALREIGLRSDLPAQVPTTEGIIASLGTLDLRGRRVGVQLYGDHPNRPLIDHLLAAGAQPAPVAPYVYADATETAQVVGLIQQLATERIDVVAFTSTPQIKRLLDVADTAGLQSALSAGFGYCRVAAIGPVVADVLREKGLRCDFMPAESFHLKPLVNELAEKLGPRLTAGTVAMVAGHSSAP